MEVQQMARRQGRQNTEATAEVNNENEEAPVSTSSTEAPATESKVEKEKAPEPDLTDFKAAVSEALSEADVTTGDVPEASLAKVTTEYRKLEGIKAKNAA